MKKLMAALASLSLLIGCTNTYPGVVSAADKAVTAVTTHGNTVVVRGTQSLILAEYAYSAIGSTVLVLLKNGTIKGEAAARVRTLNATANQWLERGYAAQDDATRALAAAEIMKAVVGLEAVKKGN